jgi:hypothetical protein
VAVRVVRVVRVVKEVKEVMEVVVAWKIAVTLLPL